MDAIAFFCMIALSLGHVETCCKKWIPSCLNSPFLCTSFLIHLCSRSRSCEPNNLFNPTVDAVSRLEVLYDQDQVSVSGTKTTLQFRRGKYRGFQENSCNENRFFLVRIDLEGVPCKPYRVWVCSARFILGIGIGAKIFCSETETFLFSKKTQIFLMFSTFHISIKPKPN